MKPLLTIFFILYIYSFSFELSAHSRYIIPSQTSLSGDKVASVSLDMSITEELFHADIALGGKPLDNPIPKGVKHHKTNKHSNRFINSYVQVISPDKSIDKHSPIFNVGRKSVSGFSLTQDGTYRVSIESEPLLFTYFIKENGKKGRVIGDKHNEKIPKNATDIKTTKMINRTETFITRNGISYDALAPQKVGLELDAKNSSHPNDAFVGDRFNLAFLLNGTPLSSGHKVKIIKGGSRYRKQPDIKEYQTDNKGAIVINWSESGMYFIELSLEKKAQNNVDIDQTRYSYSTSLEVFP